jgi:hypothetical protein
MNPLSPMLVTGTTGELLVQLRLFQYGVQAAPPLKDSGNDLIAVRGKTFKAIQIKTTSKANGWPRAPRGRLYDIFALVRLQGEGSELSLDTSDIYLIDRLLIERRCIDRKHFDTYKISQQLVDAFFPP